MVEKTRANRFICWFVEVCDCVAAETVVWGKFLRVESRLLCAATSSYERVCVKLGSFAGCMSFVSTNRSDFCVPKFPLAGCELIDRFERIVGGNPAKTSAVGAMQGYCKLCRVRNDALLLRLAALARNV